MEQNTKKILKIKQSITGNNSLNENICENNNEIDNSKKENNDNLIVVRNKKIKSKLIDNHVLTKQQVFTKMILEEKTSDIQFKEIKQIMPAFISLMDEFFNKTNKFIIDVNDLNEETYSFLKDNTLYGIIKVHFDKYSDLFNNKLKNTYKESFFEYIKNYIKKNHKYPKYNEIDNNIKELLIQNDIGEKEFNVILLQYLKNIILSGEKSIKMKYLLKDAYKKNKSDFDTFLMYGIFDENKEEFSERGEKVNKIIKEIENNLLSGIERTSSVKNNSLSVQEKFNNYIYSIFPTLNNVGVKKRVLTKEEMAEYIKNMSKK